MVVSIFQGLLLSAHLDWRGVCSHHLPILKIGLFSYYWISRTLYIIFWILVLSSDGCFANILSLSFYFLDNIIGRVEVFYFDELPIITNYFCRMLFVSYPKKKKKVDLTQSHEVFSLCFVFSWLLYMVLRYGSRFIFYIWMFVPRSH